MIMKDIYVECPAYEKKLITLRQTSVEDAEDLLKCYSDKKAVQFLQKQFRRLLNELLL